MEHWHATGIELLDQSIRWIAVKDYLPGRTFLKEGVILLLKNGTRRLYQITEEEPTTSGIHYILGRFVVDSTEKKEILRESYVTHWARIPKAPEEEIKRFYKKTKG